MRPGDWTCPKCRDNVFSWRKACNRCGESKGSSSLKTSLELVHEDIMNGQTIFKEEIPQDVIYALERQGILTSFPIIIRKYKITQVTSPKYHFSSKFYLRFFEKRCVVFLSLRSIL